MHKRLHFIKHYKLTKKKPEPVWYRFHLRALSLHLYVYFHFLPVIYDAEMLKRRFRTNLQIRTQFSLKETVKLYEKKS